MYYNNYYKKFESVATAKSTGNIDVDNAEVCKRTCTRKVGVEYYSRSESDNGVERVD